jgi:hypothetical protein
VETTEYKKLSIDSEIELIDELKGLQSSEEWNKSVYYYPQSLENIIFIPKRWYDDLMHKKHQENFQNMLDLIRSTPKEELEKYFPKERELPTGWISIEDDLPMMYIEDMFTGTEYKVKDENGKEFTSVVGDHNVWYYLAKEAGITHWWND